MTTKRPPQSELNRRRRLLMDMMGDNAIAIIPAAPVHIRNRDVHYPYRQDSDFMYLTDFLEPEAVAVFIPGRVQGEFILFCRERDEAKEIWDGWRVGQEGAVSDFGADDAFPIEDIDDILPGLLERQSRVYYTMGKHAEFDAQLMGWVNDLRRKSRVGRAAPYQFIDLEYLVHDMRLFKSRSEVALMRKAAAVTVAAHKRAMRVCQPGMHEHTIEAELLHTFRVADTEPAYPSIVGGGINGCVLHYIDNCSVLNDGDLLLIDAGAEYSGYASDVTRTFPVNGKFSSAQKEIYEVVLKAQEAAIKKAIPGNHWNEPHEAAVKELAQGMADIGLLNGDASQLIEDGHYKKFFMHKTGHWLGMDVHDVGDYKVDDEWRVLEPGMVLTVEPGLYMPPHSSDIDDRWKHIGIRIEDDVLITKDGNSVLTDALPRKVDDIEALMAG